MKLKNKKTGDIVEVLTDSIAVNVLLDRQDITGYYSSLAELNAEWEDYEEPKEYWFIYGNTVLKNECDGFRENGHKEIGNYFDTRKEAEEALEKVRAWKRLKDTGFKFNEWYRPDSCEPFIVVETNISNVDVENKDLKHELDLLFGGEE